MCVCLSVCNSVCQSISVCHFTKSIYLIAQLQQIFNDKLNIFCLIVQLTLLQWWIYIKCKNIDNLKSNTTEQVLVRDSGTGFVKNWASSQKVTQNNKLGMVLFWGWGSIFYFISGGPARQIFQYLATLYVKCKQITGDWKRSFKKSNTLAKMIERGTWARHIKWRTLYEM